MTQNRENYLQVLEEKKGACSGKHALIADLANELSVPLKLVLGIFLLTASNIPKIVSILNQYQLDAIPEAHCYLKYGRHTLDIAFPESHEFAFKEKLAQEIYISPQQIGSFKVEQHRAFIKEWVKTKPSLNFDLVWAAREQWIRELSGG